jgi:hypothetical protein
MPVLGINPGRLPGLFPPSRLIVIIRLGDFRVLPGLLLSTIQRIIVGRRAGSCQSLRE